MDSVVEQHIGQGTNAVAPEGVKQRFVVRPEIPNGGKGYLFAKRAFDMSIALVAGIILFIPMLIVAALIRVDSPGKALFYQERLGKDGKKFEIIKFRTMNMDAEANGPSWASNNDTRCTKLGAKLRKCRIDELPQLWNVIRGDMSFVGPRPEREFFYDEFETYIDGFRNRLAVTPGLTGLAQINGGYDLKPEEKVIYDMEYIKTRSFWLDLKLMFKTVKLVFTHEGAR